MQDHRLYSHSQLQCTRERSNNVPKSGNHLDGLYKLVGKTEKRFQVASFLPILIFHQDWSLLFSANTLIYEPFFRFQIFGMYVLVALTQAFAGSFFK
jgi:hypothetical protein